MLGGVYLTLDECARPPRWLDGVFIPSTYPLEPLTPNYGGLRDFFAPIEDECG